MPIALIAAAAGTKLVIGNDGDLPWHFSSDLKYFKEMTMGHPVVMGRVTYFSVLKALGKPLPGRKNIVLTRDKDFQDDRVTIIHAVSEISGLVGNSETLFIIGGAIVYEQTIDLADIIYLTYIDQEIAGDTFFPPFDKTKWTLTEERSEIEKGVTLKFQTYHSST